MRHPLFYVMTRLQLKQALRRKGLSFREANDVVSQIGNDDIDAAAETPEVGAPEFSVADSGHPVIDALIAFFGSDLGKALIAMLIKMLGL